MRTSKRAWSKGRMLVLAGLVGALLATGACAPDGPADGGSDSGRSDNGGTAQQRGSATLPPGSYTWLLDRKGTSNAQCAGETCPAPAWAGSFEVAKDGTIEGTGKLGTPTGRGRSVYQYEDVVCNHSVRGPDSILPKQDVTVSGNVPAEGKATLRLEFDADVVWDDKRHADCPADLYGTLGDKRTALEPLLIGGETRTAALRGKSGDAPVEVDGMAYALYW